MKATVNAKELRDAVRWVSKAASARSVLPILTGVMLSVEGDRLTVQATDLTVTLTQYVEAEVTDKGSMVIEAKLLKKYLAKVGKLKKSMLAIDGDTFVSELGRVKLRTVTANAEEEWPRLERFQHDDYDWSTRIDLDALPLKKLAVFMSSDDSRAALHSMLVERRIIASDDWLTYSAADGFRLMCHGPTDGEVLDSWLIPYKAINRITELKGEAVVGFNKERVCVQVGDCVVDSRLEIGTFPDYMQIVPGRDVGTWATFDTKELVNALEVLDAIDDTYANLVKLRLEYDMAILQDYGEECEAIVSANWEDGYVKNGPLRIAFSANLMLSCLALCGDETRIMFETPSKPMLIQGEALMVLMPMHIKN